MRYIIDDNAIASGRRVKYYQLRLRLFQASIGQGKLVTSFESFLFMNFSLIHQKKTPTSHATKLTGNHSSQVYISTSTQYRFTK